MSSTIAEPVDLDKVIQWIDHTKEIHPHDLTWYSANFVYLLLLYTAAAKILESYVFPKTLPKFEEYSIRSTRNMVTYVIEVIVTAYSFYLSASSGWKVYYGVHVHHDVELARLNLVILSTLYLFELSYRLEMNTQLTVHHILTLTLCILGMQGSFDTRDSRFVAAGVLMCFTANTEQSAFIALFFYRLKHKYAGAILKFSAIQTLICKVIFSLLLIIEAVTTIFGPNQLNPNGSMWYQYWKVLTFVLVPGLFLTQAYGSWVMWTIGCHANKSFGEHKQKAHKAHKHPELTPRSGSPVVERTQDLDTKIMEAEELLPQVSKFKHA